MKTLLDTNFLLLVFRNKINLEAALENLLDERPQLATLSSCVQELKMLAASKKEAERNAAKAALRWVEGGGVKVIEASGKSDKAILDWAAANKNAVVCTNDQNLRAALAAKGAKVACAKRGGALTVC
ncbi:MAG: PIN domain-containing protein [Candidatus Micrarchaeota archaeon]